MQMGIELDSTSELTAPAPPSLWFRLAAVSLMGAAILTILTREAGSGPWTTESQGVFVVLLVVNFGVAAAWFLAAAGVLSAARGLWLALRDRPRVGAARSAAEREEG